MTLFPEHEAALVTRLFNKTELFVTGLVLKEVDLEEAALVVARKLGLEPGKVLVVDARDDLITLDLLEQDLELVNIVNREKDLLDALSEVDGIKLTENSSIHSEGVLGLIGLDRQQSHNLVESVERITGEIAFRLARRALVLPTGDEIIAGRIVDTNTPFLIEQLIANGFEAESGKTLPDDRDIIIGRLSEAAMNGYGLVITTGGTGAESKDWVVEALQSLDPDAATPYTVHYTKGQGRHHKDGVRIGVGIMEHTTYIALTGPHREVVQMTPTLISGLEHGWDKGRLAEALAKLLRNNHNPHFHHGK